MADYAAVQGRTFEVDADGATVPMVLAEVRPTGTIRLPDGRDLATFVLTFHAASPAVLPQRIYRFRAPGFGETEIFIVAVGLREGGVVYEAVFS